MWSREQRGRLALIASSSVRRASNLRSQPLIDGPFFMIRIYEMRIRMGRVQSPNAVSPIAIRSAHLEAWPLRMIHVSPELSRS